MAKSMKKVDAKAVLKQSIKNDLITYFESQGCDAVIDCGLVGIEGFTKDTIIIEKDGMHVQVKLITPSAKVGNKYDLEADE